MTEHPIEGNPQDETAVGDEAVVNQPNPDIRQADDGSIVHPEGVSGPDPRFWGTDEERPDPFVQSAATGPEGVPPDTISEDGVSGPDSRWWTLGDDGQYEGRDEMNYLAGPLDLQDNRPGRTTQGGNDAGDE